MRKKAQDTFRDFWLDEKKSLKANQCVASDSVRFTQPREKVPQKNLQDKTCSAEIPSKLGRGMDLVRL